MVEKLPPSPEMQAATRAVLEHPLPCLLYDPFRLMLPWLQSLPGAVLIERPEEVSLAAAALLEDRLIVALQDRASMALHRLWQGAARSQQQCRARVVLRFDSPPPLGYDNALSLSHVSDHLPTHLALTQHSDLAALRAYSGNAQALESLEWSILTPLSNDMLYIEMDEAELGKLVQLKQRMRKLQEGAEDRRKTALDLFARIEHTELAYQQFALLFDRLDVDYGQYFNQVLKCNYNLAQVQEFYQTRLLKSRFLPYRIRSSQSAEIAQVLNHLPALLNCAF
jgi:hypothetical protein